MSETGTSDGLLRTVLVIVAVVLLLFPLSIMVFSVPMMGMMGQGFGGGPMDGMGPAWGIGMLLVWLLVLLGIGYVLYRVVAWGSGPEESTDPALEELRLAYARGDLTQEEYEERRRNLRREE